MAQQTEGTAPPGEAEQLIELEQTLQTLREDAQITHVLLGLSGALSDVRSFEETLSIAVQTVRDVLGADRCFVAALDRSRRSFSVLAAAGFDAAGGRVLDDLARDEARLPLLREAIESRQPILVPDASADVRLSDEDVSRRRLGAFIAIPVTRWGIDLGAIGVEFTAARAFAAKEATLVRGIAQTIALALSNARQFHLLDELRAFGLGVGSKLGLEPVLDEVVASATRLLSARGAGFYFLDSGQSVLVAARLDNPDDLRVDLGRIDLGRPPWSDFGSGEPLTVTDVAGGIVLVAVPGTGTGIVGAVLVFVDGEPTLGPDEMSALRVFATHVGIAVENAQRFERQRRVARSLQAGLLAVDLPQMGDCEIGTVYEPASAESDIGGDFFDIFELGDERFALVVGDVSGKGAEAAAQTAMAKYMLRAFALRNSAPASVMFHLNNALVQGFAEDRFATLLYALLDAQTHSCTLAVAGHPPPLIYRGATGEVDVVEPSGGILGAFADLNFEQETIEITTGDLFVAFTDGLTETRRGDELYGIGRLEAAVARLAPGSSASELARRLYEDARAFGTVGDDSVVLVLKCASARG